MKIVLIGPGLSPIPPTGWGAVESMVWDYYEELSGRGHTVIIVNTPNTNDMIHETNNCDADLVYIMYDDHIVLAPHIQCNNIYYNVHQIFVIERLNSSFNFMIYIYIYKCIHLYHKIL